MKNPKSRFQEPRICKNCPCSKYLNRNRPDNFDKLGAILGPMLWFLFIILIIWLIFLLSSISTEEEKNRQVNLNMTQGEFIMILSLMLILVLVWFGGILLDPLGSYIRIKRRISWPIKDNEQADKLS